MRIRINKEYCKGCGFCIEFCPKNIYEPSNELNSKGYQLPEAVRQDDCSECGLCELYCPEFAIVLKSDTQTINHKNAGIVSKKYEIRRMSRVEGSQDG